MIKSAKLKQKNEFDEVQSRQLRRQLLQVRQVWENVHNTLHNWVPGRFFKFLRQEYQIVHVLQKHARYFKHTSFEKCA